MERRALRQAVVGAACGLALAGCGDSGRAGERADSGEWKTWVLSGAGDVAVPEPSAAAIAALTGPPDADRRSAWQELEAASADSSVAPWFELAMRLVSGRAKDPPAGSRAYGLVGVASYDAAVTAARLRDMDAEDAPSHDAAIAGAASRVIAHAFPEYPRARLDALAEQAASEEASSGEVTAKAATAGLELGRSVAARVIERVRDDAPDRDDRHRPPDRDGAWAPPPGSTARPVQPRAGRWTTWVLPRGDAARPGPPPRYGSAEFVAEAREVMQVKERLTAEQKRIARFWEGGDGTELPPGIWVRVVLAHLDKRGADDLHAARVMALLTVAMADAGVAAWDAKYAYWSPRPENAIRDLGLDRSWKPLLETPFFPAYPSGHATYSSAAAEVLSHLFPQERAVWQARGEEAAMSRLYGGIHYRSDSEAGARIGERIGRLVVRRARSDGAE